MHVQRLPTRDARFDAARLRVAEPAPHFSSGWIAYREAQGYRPAWLLLSSRAGTPVACGVAWVKRPRWRPWVRPHALLDRLPWPLVGSDAASAATHQSIAHALVDHFEQAGFARAEIESFDGPWPAPDLAALGCTSRERLEFLLDLRAKTEERFAAIKSSHRRKVRDAEKAEVTVADETGTTSLALLHELQGHTQERREGRGETMSLPEAQQYERLGRCFVGGGSGRLFVGRKDGAAVSAILCGVEGSRAYYLMGGTSPAGFACNAATMVLWRASVLLAERGVVEMNLGGVPREAEQEGHAEHGLWRFKEGFGPRRVECRSGVWQRGTRR